MEATTKRLQNPNRSDINDLPNDILVHILTFLDIVEAVRTSLISRKWRTLWSLLPTLHLDHDLLPSSLRDSTERFVQFVTRVLDTRPQSIQTLRLRFESLEGYATDVDSWMSCAVTRLRAREVHLTDLSFPGGRYDFPFSVLSNGCVQVLTLKRCSSLLLPAGVSTMNLGSLRSMHLTRVHLTDEIVHDLILGCPNLEDLKLKNCDGMKNLSLCSTRLKKLALLGEICVIYVRTCEVDCPNLSSIRFDTFIEFVLKNAPSLVQFSFCKDYLKINKHYSLWRTTVGILQQAPQLKSLSLPNLWFKTLASKDPFLKSFMLRNLNHLELYTNYTQEFLIGMAALLELCPNLETMVLDTLGTSGIATPIPEDLLKKSIQWKIPRLKQLTIKLYYGFNKDQRNFLTIMKMQGVALEKIVLVATSRGEEDIVIFRVKCD